MAYRNPYFRAEVERTAQVAEVISATYARLGIEDPFFLSTDSNENNPDPASVVEYLEKLRVRSRPATPQGAQAEVGA